MKDQKKYIGIFDSGFGGLNIMRGIVKELPEYDFMYLGDTARAPYGNRSQDIVYEFTKDAVDFLFQRGCEIIVLACNTASSEALRKLQKDYISKRYPDRNVLGVIIPTAEQVVEKTKNGRIGVLATRATVMSGAFERELKKIRSDVRVFQQACPLLVPLVESGEHNAVFVELILEKYLKPLLVKKIDTLVLGCTHYGILERKIQKIAGKNVKVFSEAPIVAKKLKEYLLRHADRESRLTKTRSQLFYSTDVTEAFKDLGGRFLGKKIKVEKIHLG